MKASRQFGTPLAVTCPVSGALVNAKVGSSNSLSETGRVGIALGKGKGQTEGTKGWGRVWVVAFSLSERRLAIR